MIKIPVSIGELVDKITILEIKKEKIKDKEKLVNIYDELIILRNSIDLTNIKTYYEQLQQINLQLWNIEDKLRVKESKKEFDDEFIQLARDVYHTNDKRAAVKKQINIKTKSGLVEEKQYVSY